MIFSSIPFLFYFLPIVLGLYFIAPKPLKNTVLLLSSLVFYAWSEPVYVVLIVFSILLSYIFAICVGKAQSKNAKRILTVIPVAINMGLLGYFKYADFFISNFSAVTGLSVPLLNIALPVGISFYTFQIVSYSVDVYRGDVEVQKNPINLAAYVTMFPQLIAGPIVRYSDIEKQFRRRTHSFEKASYGLRRFAFGLAKKVILANSLGEICADFKSSGDTTVAYYWLYAIAFTLQIYFDFSGYSDMAIGLGKILGFDFLENFNYPYISSSVTEFWRRWHISLSTWFRDYVYIPLGGNRVGKLRWILNIAIVWSLTGFWHGAAWNFIAWGMLYAVLLACEKLFLLKFLKKTRFIGNVYTLLVVILGFVLFNATDISEAITYIGGMFGIGTSGIASPDMLYTLRSYALVIVLAVVASTPLAKNAVERIKQSRAGERLVNTAEPIAIIAIFIIVVAYLVDGSFNPFLYFRF